jgi:hypothetical protein
VARRVVQVSTLRNYARCQIPRWYGVTRLPPDTAVRIPPRPFRKSIHRICEHRPPLHILEGGTRNVGILEIPPQTPQKCDLYGISGDQTTCSQPLPMRVQAATAHSRNRGGKCDYRPSWPIVGQEGNRTAPGRIITQRQGGEGNAQKRHHSPPDPKEIAPPQQAL